MLSFLLGMLSGIALSLLVVIFALYWHALFSPAYDEVTAKNYDDGRYVDIKKAPGRGRFFW